MVTKKWGEKRAKQIFQKHSNRASKKCWEKNRRKIWKKMFFIFTRISLPKKGGKTRETIYPETQQIVRANNVWKKIVATNCEISFFI